MLKIIKRNKYIITIVIILLTISFCLIRINNLKEQNKSYTIEKNNDIIVTEKTLPKEKEKIKISKIKIDIKGQINNPGVYELEENTRIIDAINIAGGLTEIANTSLINLAKTLEDGMVIIIYSNEEVANSNKKEVETVFKIIEQECNCPNIKNDGCINTELDNDNSNEEENSKIVNINTASLEELMTLPSIGESKAKAIIEYREENKFTKIEDIKNVSGIGESLFEKIKTFIII